MMPKFIYAPVPLEGHYVVGKVEDRQQRLLTLEEVTEVTTRLNFELFANDVEPVEPNKC